MSTVTIRMRPSECHGTKVEFPWGLDPGRNSCSARRRSAQAQIGLQLGMIRVNLGFNIRFKMRSFFLKNDLHHFHNLSSNLRYKYLTASHRESLKNVKFRQILHNFRRIDLHRVSGLVPDLRDNNFNDPFRKRSFVCPCAITFPGTEKRNLQGLAGKPGCVMTSCSLVSLTKHWSTWASGIRKSPTGRQPRRSSQ